MSQKLPHIIYRDVSIRLNYETNELILYLTNIHHHHNNLHHRFYHQIDL
jgi:hypothetical protein